MYRGRSGFDWQPNAACRERPPGHVGTFIAGGARTSVRAEIKKRIRAFPRKCGILAAISCTVHWAMLRLRRVRVAPLGGTLTCG